MTTIVDLNKVYLSVLDFLRVYKKDNETIEELAARTYFTIGLFSIEQWTWHRVTDEYNLAKVIQNKILYGELRTAIRKDSDEFWEAYLKELKDQGKVYVRNFKYPVCGSEENEQKIRAEARAACKKSKQLLKEIGDKPGLIKEKADAKATILYYYELMLEYQLCDISDVDLSVRFVICPGPQYRDIAEEILDELNDLKDYDAPNVVDYIKTDTVLTTLGILPNQKNSTYKETEFSYVFKSLLFNEELETSLQKQIDAKNKEGKEKQKAQKETSKG